MFIADFVNYEKVFKLDEENGVNDDDEMMIWTLMKKTRK